MAHFASYSDSPPPGDENLLLHEPDGDKSQWHHIENLDLFFRRVYNLHQKNGFACMLLGEIFELVRLPFVVAFTLFLLYCVDYDVLFANKHVANHAAGSSKVTLFDAVLPADVCGARIRDSRLVIFVLAISAAFWLHRLLKFACNVCRYWRIRSFYVGALGMPMSELTSVRWQEVQARIMEVQKEHQMCISKRELSELDIYHRILRFENYMVAMVNRSLLPVCFRPPLLGEIAFYTCGLRYNFELIFFWGPGSLFESEWSLKREYKRGGERLELADKLASRILWIGIANLLLCPVILVWQFLYAFFNYTGVIMRQPDYLGARSWSLYGRCNLRHFNELDHELASRLGSAYEASSKYLNCFRSPLLTVVAKNVAFFAGSLLAVLVILTVYDEDVLQVEYVLSAITLLGVCVSVCSSLIRHEHRVSCPEQLLRAVLAHINYAPEHWRGNAHRHETRRQFCLLFQYKAVIILEELLSPVVTPFILLFSLRRKALEIVDFFRNFTVEVVGLGDVCSFSEMDVGRHGHPAWTSGGTTTTEASVHRQAEGGKTELSLMHFAIANPRWQPPHESERFISQFKERVQREADPHTVTLLSRSEPRSLVSNLLAGSTTLASVHSGSDGSWADRAAVNIDERASSPLSPDSSGLLPRGSFNAHGDTSRPLMADSGAHARAIDSGGSAWEGQTISSVLSEYASSAEMSMHVLYMHDFHEQRSHGEQSHCTWHVQESGGAPDEVRSDPNPQASRHFPGSHTFHTSVSTSPSDINTGQEWVSLQSRSQRHYGGTTTDSLV